MCSKTQNRRWLLFIRWVLAVLTCGCWCGAVLVFRKPSTPSLGTRGETRHVTRDTWPGYL